MIKATNTAPSYYQPPRDSLPAAHGHINPVARGAVSSAHPRGMEAAELTAHRALLLNVHLGRPCFSVFLMCWSDITVMYSELISIKTSISE